MIFFPPSVEKNRKQFYPEREKKASIHPSLPGTNDPARHLQNIYFFLECCCKVRDFLLSLSYSLSSCAWEIDIGDLRSPGKETQREEKGVFNSEFNGRPFQIRPEGRIDKKRAKRDLLSLFLPLLH